MSELNQLSNSKYAYLSRLSLEELLDLLYAAPVPASTPEQEAYVDALKEAIIEQETEHPTGFFPDPDQQWKQFVTHYLPCVEEDPFEPVCTGDDGAQCASQPSPGVPPERARRSRRFWRTLLVAAAAVGCMFAAMVVAQASGVDVFGAMARWTEDAFSFNRVPPDSELTENLDKTGGAGQERSFASLQEALDAYGVTAVHEPAQLPDGFVIDKCGVEYSNAPYAIAFYADYVNGGDDVKVDIMSYEDTPAILIQKTNVQPELVEFEGITFYLIENASSFITAWYDDEYEYYVSGKLDRDTLWEIAISMLE